MRLTREEGIKLGKYSFWLYTDSIPRLDKADKSMVVYHKDKEAYEIKNDFDVMVRVVLSIAHLEVETSSDKNPSYRTFVNLLNKYKAFVTDRMEDKVKFNPDLFKIQPKPHQIDSVDYLLKKRQYLLADEMGSGKTMSAVYSASLFYPYFKHVIVICGKASLQMQWKAEIEKFSNMDAHVIGSRVNRNGKIVIDSIKKKTEELKKGRDEYFLITNIETFRDKDFSKQVQKMIKNGDVPFVIIDEAHVVANTGSSQGENVVRFYVHPPYRLPMTGTPLFNRPEGIYGLLKWIGVYTGPKDAYVNLIAIKDHFGKIIEYQNLDKVKKALNTKMLKRKAPHETELHVQEKVLWDPKVLGIGGFYEQRLETALSQVKIDAVKEDVQEILSQGDKVLVVSFLKTHVIDAYADALGPDICIATGDNSVAERDSIIQEFKTSKTKNVLLASSTAIGTGTNLKEAKYILIISRPPGWSELQQVMARIHRLDSDTDVHAFIYKIADSIDTNRMDELIEMKKDFNDDMGLLGAEEIH